MDNKKAVKTFTILFIFLIFAILWATASFAPNGETLFNTTAPKAKEFHILSSQENAPLADIVNDYAQKQGYVAVFTYAGTLDIIQTINNESANYDAMWISNSIWGYMVNNNVTISNSKCTSINPVVFGIKKSKAQELGFIGKTIYTKDIVDAISSGKLKFSMSNPTSTNSGASAYLGMLATLAGNPEVLTADILENDTLKEELKTLFLGMERSSGSEDFLEELFLNGEYEAVVAYESSIININKQLEATGRETLYAVYPVDGVSISDSPFAYIDNKNNEKKKMFNELQNYILSSEGQKLLQEKGKRTWYGGVSATADKNIFNPEWGIDTTKYISPIKYPSTDVIRQALNLYQSQLRKPTHVVFCLDFSGSMLGNGIKQLRSAMQYILTDEASKDFIQFAEDDKIDILPFSSSVGTAWSTTNGTKTENLLRSINNYPVNGATAIYKVAMEAMELLKNENTEKYNVSIVLMTDGQSNVGTYEEFKRYCTYFATKIPPIYSIIFGEADRSELERIAFLTNGKVFDGKSDLVRAFKEVRGYN